MLLGGLPRLSANVVKHKNGGAAEQANCRRLLPERQVEHCGHEGRAAHEVAGHAELGEAIEDREREESLADAARSAQEDADGVLLAPSEISRGPGELAFFGTNDEAIGKSLAKSLCFFDVLEPRGFEAVKGEAGARIVSSDGRPEEVLQGDGCGERLTFDCLGSGHLFALFALTDVALRLAKEPVAHVCANGLGPMDGALDVPLSEGRSSGELDDLRNGLSRRCGDFRMRHGVLPLGLFRS